MDAISGPPQYFSGTGLGRGFWNHLSAQFQVFSTRKSVLSAGQFQTCWVKRAVRDPHSQRPYFETHSQGQSWLKKGKLGLQGSSSWPSLASGPLGHPFPRVTQDRGRISYKGMSNLDSHGHHSQFYSREVAVCLGVCHSSRGAIGPEKTKVVRS